MGDPSHRSRQIGSSLLFTRPRDDTPIASRVERSMRATKIRAPSPSPTVWSSPPTTAAMAPSAPSSSMRPFSSRGRSSFCGRPWPSWPRGAGGAAVWVWVWVCGEAAASRAAIGCDGSDAPLDVVATSRTSRRDAHRLPLEEVATSRRRPSRASRRGVVALETHKQRRRRGARCHDEMTTRPAGRSRTTRRARRARAGVSGSRPPRTTRAASCAALRPRAASPRARDRRGRAGLCREQTKGDEERRRERGGIGSAAMVTLRAVAAAVGTPGALVSSSMSRGQAGVVLMRHTTADEVTMSRRDATLDCDEHTRTEITR